MQSAAVPLLLCLAMGCSRGREQPPERAGGDYLMGLRECSERRGRKDIKNAVHHEREVWAVSWEGHLWSLAPSLAPLIRRLPDDHVVDIARSGDTLAALVGGEAGPEVRLHRDGLWFSRVKVPPGLEPIALVGAPSLLVVLGVRSAFVISGAKLDQTSLVRLDRPLPVTSAAIAVAASPDAIYLVSHGEEFSVLVRVDLRSGTSARIERIDGGGLCAGPLNSACDRIGWLFADESESGCVYVGLSAVHDRDRFSLLRVCGHRVETVCRKRDSGQWKTLFSRARTLRGMSSSSQPEIQCSDGEHHATIANVVAPPPTREICGVRTSMLDDGVVLVGGRVAQE